MIPKYLKLKEIIMKDILLEKYPLNSKLPTENELAKEYNVSRSTIRQTLELLENDGIISKHWGSGNTVISRGDSSYAKSVIVARTEKNNFLTEDASSLLMKEGLNLTQVDIKNDFSIERDLLNKISKDIYYGLIIEPAVLTLPSVNIDLYQKLLKRQLPIVFIGGAPAGLYNPTIVKCDYYDKGYQTARKFINNGCKNLGGIFVRDSLASVDCFSGFLDAIRDANLDLLSSCFLWIDMMDLDGHLSRSEESIKSFLDVASAKADIIYCDDDLLQGSFRQRLEFSSLQPRQSIGKAAAQKLLAIKKDGDTKSVTISYK